MKTISILPGTPMARLIERPEPSIAAADEVSVRMIRVGICGTDREEVAGGRAQAPDGQHELIIGHEMFGRVTAVGHEVTRVQPGDYAVFAVRRGCGACLPCAIHRYPCGEFQRAFSQHPGDEIKAVIEWTPR